ncbi:MAG: hypothetical protein LBC53_10825 [Spirochaetaceae bacterium]|nr:hypothetical protein [Spirochaetaceae bacterium]
MECEIKGGDAASYAQLMRQTGGGGGSFAAKSRPYFWFSRFILLFRVPF